MHIGLPQAILLGSLLISCGLSLARDGEIRHYRCSFSRTLVELALWFWLLWWGGFFSGPRP